ncbi:MAG TPA: ThiF family adenylyltransferase [Pilimelia sp.]|nr:ThiF family adenylyltransferase [Pilimelia sp.]
MTVTLVLPDLIAAELTRIARRPIETGAVLLAGVAQDGSDLRVLARELHEVPEERYLIRQDDELLIASGGFVPPLRRAEETGTMAIWVHTHPGGLPVPSRHDHRVDDQLTETFRTRTGHDFYGSLVLSPGPDGGLEFTGHVRGAGVRPIERMWLTGPRFRLTSAYDSTPQEHVPSIYDRQVRAFGGDIQAVLRSLRIGVIGCGGTGSAVTEQLARLGVGRLLLMDPDIMEDTNLTRVYGSSPAVVGMPKAESLTRHVASIAPGVHVERHQGAITDVVLARAASTCDVLFGCTDDQAGRMIMSRLSSYYLLPVIDCGVLLSSADGRLLGIDGRVTLLAPGYPCLLCRGRIDIARAMAEQLSPDERALRAREGYAPELGAIEPAVVAYTTLVASLAVAELLERLTRYGPEPAPSELLVRAHEREISTNARIVRPGHYCDPAAGVLGAGDIEPFLGMMWNTN